MKKYLLTGSLASILLLAACGTSNENTTEETSEESTTKSSDLVTENEELKEQNQQLQEQIATLEEELALTSESESLNVETEEIEAEEESSVDSMENIKEVILEETIDIENVKVTVHRAQINRVDVNEDLAIFLDGYEEGDKVDNLVIEYTVENTTEAPRTFYIDQSVVVTSTGQQLEPEMFLADGIETDMLGAISSTGTVPYIMDEGAGDDIEWVDVNLKYIIDAESYERVADETKYRIEF